MLNYIGTETHCFLIVAHCASTLNLFNSRACHCFGCDNDSNLSDKSPIKHECRTGLCFSGGYNPLNIIYLPIRITQCFNIADSTLLWTRHPKKRYICKDRHPNRHFFRGLFQDIGWPFRFGSSRVQRGFPTSNGRGKNKYTDRSSLVGQDRGWKRG